MKKIAKTRSDLPLVYKRIHSFALSSNIYNDMEYQEQIVNGYDVLWNEVKSLNDEVELKKY